MTALLIGESPQYRCKAGQQLTGQPGCRGGYVKAELLEEAVLEWLTGLVAEVEMSRAAAAAANAHRTTVRVDADRVARQVQRAEEALTRLAIQHAETPLDPAVYRQAHGELSNQLASLRATHEEIARDARRAVGDPGAIAQDLLAGWETRPVAQRREVLSTLLSHVEVVSGRPPARKIRVVSTWEDDAEQG